MLVLIWNLVVVLPPVLPTRPSISRSFSILLSFVRAVPLARLSPASRPYIYAPRVSFHHRDISLRLESASSASRVYFPSNRSVRVIRVPNSEFSPQSYFTSLVSSVISSCVTPATISYLWVIWEPAGFYTRKSHWKAYFVGEFHFSIYLNCNKCKFLFFCWDRLKNIDTKI